MATSHLKTPLARLRKIIGKPYGQLDNFCLLTGLSKSLVEKICAGFRPMTEDTAVVIANATGVDAQWLLSGGKSNPVDIHGQPYTKESFLHRRAEIAAGGGSLYDKTSTHFITTAIARIVGMVNADPAGAAVLAYRLTKFVDELDFPGAVRFENRKAGWLFEELGAVAKSDRAIVFPPGYKTTDKHPSPAAIAKKGRSKKPV